MSEPLMLIDWVRFTVKKTNSVSMLCCKCRLGLVSNYLKKSTAGFISAVRAVVWYFQKCCGSEVVWLVLHCAAVLPHWAPDLSTSESISLKNTKLLPDGSCFKCSALWCLAFQPYTWNNQDYYSTRWLSGWMDGWVHIWIKRWIAWRIDGWTNEWVTRWMDWWMDGWLDGWIEEEMNKLVDG